MSVYYKILLFESKTRDTNVFRPKINQREDVWYNVIFLKGAVMLSKEKIQNYKKISF